jgi:hypothetical protein
MFDCLGQNKDTPKISFSSRDPRCSNPPPPPPPPPCNAWFASAAQCHNLLQSPKKSTHSCNRPGSLQSSRDAACRCCNCDRGVHARRCQPHTRQATSPPAAYAPPLPRISRALLLTSCSCDVSDDAQFAFPAHNAVAIFDTNVNAADCSSRAPTTLLHSPHSQLHSPHSQLCQ